MITTNLKFSTDLDKGLVMTPLANAFMSGDDEAHLFVVSCYSGIRRTPFDLTGAAVTGYFVRADSTTVIIEGDVQDNAANVLLPAECYAIPGLFSLVIKAARGASIHSVLWAQGAVSRSHTDAAVDPGQVLPSLDELLAKIATMEEATKRAEAAAYIAESKLDKALGTEYAGKLLYVDGNGSIVTLALGAGLVIENGILRVIGGGNGGGSGDSGSGDSGGEVVASLVVDADGKATLIGATLTVDAEGNAWIGGADVFGDGAGGATIG